MEEKEFSNIYAIPANYTDSGKLLGGMVETRCAVEAIFLVGLVGYPELFWIPMPTTIRIVCMTVTLLPLGVVALMGADGGSLLQYLWNILPVDAALAALRTMEPELFIRADQHFLQVFSDVFQSVIHFDIPPIFKNTAARRLPYILCKLRAGATFCLS